MPDSTDFDAIVIGAGHNGLAAAALLQGAGLHTVCLDAKLYAGGMASTVELFDGYKFEIAQERSTLKGSISALNEELAALQSQLAQVKAKQEQTPSCWVVLIAVAAAAVFFVSLVVLVVENELGVLPLPIIAGSLLAVVLLASGRASNARKREMANLTQQVAEKEREVATVQQRHDALSLRRTGEDCP